MAQGGYRPPPGPYLGGRQPYEPRRLPPSLVAVQVDAPPPRGASLAAALAIVATAWAGQAAAQAWSVAVETQRRPSVVAVPGASIDNPPVSTDAEYYELVRAAWDASTKLSWPWHYDPPELLVQGAAAPADLVSQLPGPPSATLAWFVAPLAPQQQRQLDPALLAPVADTTVLSGGGGWPRRETYHRRDLPPDRALRRGLEHLVGERDGRTAETIEERGPAPVAPNDRAAIRLAQIRANLDRALLALEQDLQRSEDEDDEDLLLLTS